MQRAPTDALDFAEGDLIHSDSDSLSELRRKASSFLFFLQLFALPDNSTSGTEIHTLHSGKSQAGVNLISGIGRVFLDQFYRIAWPTGVVRKPPAAFQSSS